MNNSMQHTSTTNANGLPVVPRPCPTWCEMPAGHGWDSEDGPDVEMRVHALLIGEIDGGSSNVSIEALEICTRGGASTFTPTTITVDSRVSDTELTVDQARQLADLLVLAAARVEAL